MMGSISLDTSRPISHEYLKVALSKLATVGLAVVSVRLIETGGKTFYRIIACRRVEDQP